MSLLVSPRVLYLVWAEEGAWGKSSRPCQRTLLCSAPCERTAACSALCTTSDCAAPRTVQGALQCSTVRAYMGPLWADTHTLGDPKPPDQGHTVTQTQIHTLRHRETHAPICMHPHTRTQHNTQHNTETHTHTQGDPKSQLMGGRPPSCHKADPVCHTPNTTQAVCHTCTTQCTTCVAHTTQELKAQGPAVADLG